MAHRFFQATSWAMAAEMLKVDSMGAAAQKLFISRFSAKFVWFFANFGALHVQIVNKSDSTVNKRLNEEELSLPTFC